MNMGIAMGLEPIGVMGQSCPSRGTVTEELQVQRSITYGMIFMMVVLAISTIVLAVYGWKKLKELGRELYYAQVQLADHYDYAAWSCDRLDNIGWQGQDEERLDRLTARLAVHEEDTRDGLQVLDESTDSLRYGLMEMGGFSREGVLTSAQRAHMFVQERANFTLWRMKQRNPDTTDEPMEEAAESESPTDDETGVAGPSESPLERLLANLRGEQNAALAVETFSDASQIQGAIKAVLDANANATGVTVSLVNELRNIFQRMFRVARNRGDEERATSYRRYVDDLHGMMGGGA